jgi:hypothetical protein
MTVMFENEYRIVHSYFGKRFELQHAVPLESGKGWNTILYGTEKECNIIGNALVSIGKDVQNGRLSKKTLKIIKKNCINLCATCIHNNGNEIHASCDLSKEGKHLFIIQNFNCKDYNIRKQV